MDGALNFFLTMQTRHAISSREAGTLSSQELRGHFLLEQVLSPGNLHFTYVHYDRLLVGGAMPTASPLSLPNYPLLRSAFFLERRELGVINVGGPGTIVADGQSFALPNLGGLYLGRGTQEVVFHSDDRHQPAQFYLLSTPAHQTYPTAAVGQQETNATHLGEANQANRRTIYRYIHLEGIRSCQLVMGLTLLESGSVWNTMPAHVHDRRTEVYFYFQVPPDHSVLHLMGEPQATRHLWVANHQAVVSPPWSIHAGCGTAPYGFIWGMGGENQEYSDMDALTIVQLR